MKSLTLVFYAIATFLLAALVYVAVTVNAFVGIGGISRELYSIISVGSQWAMLAGPLAFLAAAVAIAGGEDKRDQQAIALAVLMFLAILVLVAVNR